MQLIRSDTVLNLEQIQFEFGLTPVSPTAGPTDCVRTNR
jgi:hypothetical protein